MRVYLITDRRRVDDLPEALDRVLHGVSPGEVGIQLREKDLPPVALAALARRVATVCAAHGAPLWVNTAENLDDLPRHLSEASLGRVAPGPRDAVSTHDLAGLRRARGAALAVLGPVFPTAGKAAPGEELGLARFAAWIAEARAEANPVPVYALGGVDARRVADCRAAGAAGVAVIGAVWSAASPVAALRELLQG